MSSTCMAISLSVQQPWWLLVALLAIVPVIASQMARRAGRPTARFVTIGRSLAVVLVALAMSRLAIGGVGRQARPWLILRDVSGSTRGQQDRPLDLPETVDTETLYWAAGLAEAPQAVDDGATDLASALRLAEGRAAAGQLGGLIIQTDGRFTDVGWPSAAERLAGGGIRTLIIPLASPPADGRIADLSVRRGRDDRVTVSVTVSVSATQQRTVVIERLTGGPARLLTRTLQLMPDQPATLHLTDRVPPDRIAEYRAVLEGEDAFPENDRVTSLLLPQEQRIVVVSADQTTFTRQLAEEHQADWLAAGETPVRMADWLAYACVVLVDATGDALSAPQREALSHYVRAGGGLLIIGSGPRETPSDLKDPLNCVAALAPNFFERRPLAVSVVLDASGSMARPSEVAPGRSRFDQARQATLALQEHLTDEDTLETIVFSDQPRRVFDSGEGPPDFATLDRAMQSVQPGGPTDVWPAIREAARSGPGDRRRLIIVVSDLDTKPIDLAEAQARLAEARASLAIVGISSEDIDGSPSPLTALARAVDATIVERQDLASLAEVFGRFVRQHRGAAVREGEFPLPASWLSGMSLASPGKLDAYLLSAPTDETSQVLGRIDGDPVVALRRVGLGRSAAAAIPIMPEPERDSATRRFAREIVEVLLPVTRRPDSDPRFTGDASHLDGSVSVWIEVIEGGRPLNGLSLELRCADAMNDGTDAGDAIRMRQVSPGRYEGMLQGPNRSALSLSVVDEAGREVWRGPLRGAYRDEYRGIGVDWPNLRRLEQRIGGRIITAGQVARPVAPTRGPGNAGLWPWLLSAALVVTLATWLGRWPSARRGVTHPPG